MSTTASLGNSLKRIHSLFNEMIQIGLYVQLTSAIRDSGAHYYYLKIYRVATYCELCRFPSRKAVYTEEGMKVNEEHEGAHRLEIEFKSVHNEVYYDLAQLFSSVVEVYMKEKNKSSDLFS